MTLGQVQADELRVRMVGGVVWVAMALRVTSRLWLGGTLSVRRDRTLIGTLLVQVRACGAIRKVVLASDGLIRYPRQAVRRFRQAIRTGMRGRPRLVLPDDLRIVQAIKRYRRRRVAAVERRIVRGSEEAVGAALTATQGKPTAVINTAYIERLNATFRSRFAALVRRGRTMVRQVATVEAGMWLVGTASNFCTAHRSLDGQAPAQAAGLTDHCWTMGELLTYRVPLPVVKRRGRRPYWLRQVTHAA